MSTKRSRLKRAAVIEDEKDLEDENDDFANSAKIHAPIVWGHLPAGFEIRDVEDSQYDEIRQFIIDNYLPNDLLCINSNISSDYESQIELVNAHMFVIKDKCSICAMEEATQRLAAVLILRVINKADYGKVHSRVKLTEGEAYKKIRKALDYLNRKSDIFTKYQCDKYLRCYMVAVHNDFRHKAIGLQLLRASIDVARSLKVSVVMGIFATNLIQKKAKKIGLEVVNEIYYVDWVEKGEIIFSDPGPGNYTLALMAGRVPALT